MLQIERLKSYVLELRTQNPNQLFHVQDYKNCLKASFNFRYSSGRYSDPHCITNLFLISKEAEYKRLGEDILYTSMQILEKGEWKKEKSIKGDLVQSKIIAGKKVFKLTVSNSAKACGSR